MQKLRVALNKKGAGAERLEKWRCAPGSCVRLAGSAAAPAQLELEWGLCSAPGSSDTGINSEGGPAPALRAQRARSNNSPLIPWQGHLISLRQRAK